MASSDFTPADVQKGLSAGEFYLRYMPTVALADGRCVGAEALARWKRPAGLVPPNDFIPLIERTSVSGLLTYWVVETVAQELGDYLRQNTDFHLGINVPPEILGRGSLEYVGRRAGLLDISKQFILEVTERGLPDQQGLEFLAAASRRGVRIALDDVTLSGVNLTHFSRGHVDIIKLDRSLTARITADDPHPDWLGSVAALVRSNSVLVIAEGVETEGHVSALRAAGVPMAQGYYFSQPLEAEELKRFCGRSGT